MRSIVKYIIAKTYKPLLIKYLAVTRWYSYKGIALEIPPAVFHPGFFYSTKILLRYLKHKQLLQKTFLELGAGSGLISIYAAQKGAHVTATDINPVAIDCIRKNARLNHVSFSIINSDLFKQIPRQSFDMVVINPPYYKKDPVSNVDYAWYCGENGEYFENLFKDLEKYMHEHTEVFMVLCDGCDMQMIHQFAIQNGFTMHSVYTKNTIVEKNFVFKIEHSNAFSH